MTQKPAPEPQVAKMPIRDNRKPTEDGRGRDKEASEEASLEEADKEDKAATTHMDFTIPVPAEPRLGTSCASEAGQRAAGSRPSTGLSGPSPEAQKG